MTTPDVPPAGLGPLCAEPVDLYPPFRQHPAPWGRFPERDERYRALLTALGDVELGSFDVRILHWLAGWEPSTVGTVCSLIHRARAAGHREGSTP